MGDSHKAWRKFKQQAKRQYYQKRNSRQILKTSVCRLFWGFGDYLGHLKIAATLVHNLTVCRKMILGVLPIIRLY